MTKLNLDNYSDKEVVAAILNLPGMKFMSVINGLGAVSQSMEQRGKLIARDTSFEEIDNMIRKMFEGEE